MGDGTVATDMLRRRLWWFRIRYVEMHFESAVKFDLM